MIRNRQLTNAVMSVPDWFQFLCYQGIIVLSGRPKIIEIFFYLIRSSPRHVTAHVNFISLIWVGIHAGSSR